MSSSPRRTIGATMINTKFRNAILFTVAAVGALFLGYFLASSVSDIAARSISPKTDNRPVVVPSADADAKENEFPIAAALEVGDTLRDYVFEDIDRNPLRLSDLTSKITLLVFFQPDCSGCEMEIEDLNRTLRDSLDSRYFLFISPGNPRLIEDMKRDYHLHAPVLYDHRAAFTYGMYRIAAYPYNVVIDKDMVVKDIILGSLPEDELARIVDANK